MPTTQETIIPDYTPDNLTQRGLAIYDTRLKAQLEPERNGQFVAIHVDTGDHVVASRSGDAMRAMRAIHDQGPLVLMRIGPEPEYGLAACLLAGQRQTGRKK